MQKSPKDLITFWSILKNICGYFLVNSCKKLGDFGWVCSKVTSIPIPPLNVFEPFEFEVKLLHVYDANNDNGNDRFEIRRRRRRENENCNYSCFESSNKYWTARDQYNQTNFAVIQLPSS